MDKYINVANWFSVLLSERWQCDVKIDYCHDKFILSLDSRNVIFKNINPSYYEPSHDLGCFWWNVDYEKFSCLNKISNKLPIPTSKRIDEPLIKVSNDIEVSFDFIGMAFWTLSRMEEVDNPNIDGHSRFPALFSHAYKFNYLNRPFIDEWINAISCLIMDTWPELTLYSSNYELNISHDVDRPARFAFTNLKSGFRGVVGDIIKRQDYMAPIKLIFSRFFSSSEISQHDSFNTFSWIVEQAEKHNQVNTFYFLSGSTCKKHDGDYEINHPSIQGLLKFLDDNNQIIGLHPSYNCYLNAHFLQEEKSRLICSLDDIGIRLNEIGVRMHFLRWKTPETIVLLDKLGFSHDSTLGYADLPGFRCGTCFDYRAIHPLTQETLNITIRPLILMEASLIEKRYLGITNVVEGIEYISSLRLACQSVGGKFNVLWHNSELDTQDKRELYLSLYDGNI